MPKPNSFKKKKDTNDNFPISTLLHYFSQRQGIMWVGICLVLGVLLGFIVGAGFLEHQQKTQWRTMLAERMRATTGYRVMTLQEDTILGAFVHGVKETVRQWEREVHRGTTATNGNHPTTIDPQLLFGVLREAIIREEGGYVHPDLGWLIPAPSGASRGLGLVQDSFHRCQIECFPGYREEKVEQLHKYGEGVCPPIPESKTDDIPTFYQEEVLIRVPLSYQMTRKVAIETLTRLIPVEVQRKAGFFDLDDAAILTLLLAHERGVGRYSRWMPYIASLLPVDESSCGYARMHRGKQRTPPILPLGFDTHGWTDEWQKASHYANKIAESLSRDYGQYIQRPVTMSPTETIAWALCHVASRAIAGSERHGTLRLVPMIDMVNHDVTAGMFYEMNGTESMQKGDFVSAASETDSGTFALRSLRHRNRRRPLDKGQELLANYNVPRYSPLDWWISMGFVPPERQGAWTKVDPVLPVLRREDPSAEYAMTTEDIWKEKDPALLHPLQQGSDL